MDYKARIASALNDGDNATLALVEDLMRTEHGTLDHLSADRFNRAALRARATAVELAVNGMLGEYCEPLGLAVPALRV